MKTWIRGMLLALLLAMGLTIPAYADSGPKPSVTVTFTGIQEPYYVTLLSKEQSTGPYSAVESDAQPPETDADIWTAFAQYQDADGYYFLDYFQSCTDSGRFCWGYYPPEQFKVLVYFPERGEFAVSQVCTQYAFDSYFYAEVQADGTLTANYSTYFPVWQAAAFLARLVLTVCVEILLAAAFGIFGRRLWVVLGVNVATQLALNLCLFWGGYQPVFLYYVLQYFLLELGIIAVEAAIYCVCLPKMPGKKLGRPRLAAYAVTANVGSFLVGYGIARLAPNLF